MHAEIPEKILLVDDDRQIVAVLRCYMENHGFKVVYTDNSLEAVMLAKESRPDLVLTDETMPGLDGIALCCEVKAFTDRPPTPVIIMSGNKMEVDDIVSGYSGGADDYIIKPFSFTVLAAKIHAVLRRYRSCSGAGSESINRLGMTIDPGARSVLVKKRRVPLTRKEFDLLALLMEKEGHILSVPYILETVWGYDPAKYNDPHTVEVHIYSLRKKLGPSIAGHIVSILGHGYKFE